ATTVLGASTLPISLGFAGAYWWYRRRRMKGQVIDKDAVENFQPKGGEEKPRGMNSDPTDLSWDSREGQGVPCAAEAWAADSSAPGGVREGWAEIIPPEVIKPRGAIDLWLSPRPPVVPPVAQASLPGDLPLNSSSSRAPQRPATAPSAPSGFSSLLDALGVRSSRRPASAQPGGLGGAARSLPREAFPPSSRSPPSEPSPEAPETPSAAAEPETGGARDERSAAAAAPARTSARPASAGTSSWPFNWFESLGAGGSAVRPTSAPGSGGQGGGG
ncbi:unnamed protein product, partial [Polarella glacialis]